MSFRESLIDASWTLSFIWTVGTDTDTVASDSVPSSSSGSVSTNVGRCEMRCFYLLFINRLISGALVMFKLYALIMGAVLSDLGQSDPDI